MRKTKTPRRAPWPGQRQERSKAGQSGASGEKADLSAFDNWTSFIPAAAKPSGLVEAGSSYALSSSVVVCRDRLRI